MLITPVPAQDPSRRHFLGCTLSGAAIALLAGNARLAAAASSRPVDDAGILNVALALEHQGIAAYQLGAESGLLQKPVLDIAILFQSHHKAHRDALVATIEKLGGKAVASRSNADYAEALGAARLRSQGDVLDLAVANNIVEKSGAWYSYAGERIGQGRENTRSFLKENKDTFAKMDAELRKKLAIGAVKAEVPEVPASGPAEAKEVVRGRRGAV